MSEYQLFIACLAFAITTTFTLCLAWYDARVRDNRKYITRK